MRYHRVPAGVRDWDPVTSRKEVRRWEGLRIHRRCGQGEGWRWLVFCGRVRDEAGGLIGLGMEEAVVEAFSWPLSLACSADVLPVSALMLEVWILG